MMIKALQIFCGCCGRIFGVCRDCYRGHKYCSDDCRKAGYDQTHREAQSSYRKTAKGKEQHIKSEKKRRKNKKLKRTKIINSVMNACMCFSMAIKSLFLNYNPDLRHPLGYSTLTQVFPSLLTGFHGTDLLTI